MEMIIFHGIAVLVLVVWYVLSSSSKTVNEDHKK
jgi:hypothetical protein